MTSNDNNNNNNNEPNATVVTGENRGIFWKLQERIEAMRRQNTNFTGFFCCNIRIATIAVGVWHASFDLAALCMIAIIVSKPEIHTDSDNLSFFDDHTDKSFQLPTTPTTTTDLSLFFRNFLTGICIAGDGTNIGFCAIFAKSGFTKSETNLAILFNLCTLVLAIVLMYGACRFKPSHLMPFFFLKVFDFCICTMTIIGYLSYPFNFVEVMRDTSPFIIRQPFLGMNANFLKFVVIVIFISTILIKGYWISIVWRCYKFFQSLGHVDRENHHHVGDGDDGLPDYETVITQYENKFSHLYPPTYKEAMREETETF